MRTHHTYRCGRGHVVSATQPITRCPGLVKGVPCKGKLAAVPYQRWLPKAWGGTG